MRKLHFSEADLAEMERLYTEEQLSTMEIAARFGCLMGSIWARLKRRGISMRPVNYRRPRRRKHSQGYSLVGGEYEHRLVAEKMLDRKLLPTEHVHHRNGDRTDNRPENLEVLPASAHQRHHGAEAEKWTPEMDAAMIAWRAEGHTSAWIGAQLGVSRNAIYNRIRRLRRRDGRVIPKMRVGAPPGGRLCSVPGCSRKHRGLGFCNRHYLRHTRQARAA